MKGPYMTQLSDAMMTPLQRQHGPRNAPAYTGMNLPQITFTPNQPMSILMDERGQIAKRTSVNTEMPSNTFVSNPIIANGTRGGAEKFLLPGMLYFTERSSTYIQLTEDKVVKTETIKGIGEVNKLLTGAWMRLYGASQGSPGDPVREEAVKFLDVLRKYSERFLAFYAHAKMTGMDNTKIKSIADDKNLEWWYNMCFNNEKTLDFALCSCPQSVLNVFNFGGVVRNVNLDSSVGSVGARTSATIVNGVTSHYTEVHDIFSPCEEMHVGSVLGLHLHRKPYRNFKDTEDSYGAFVFEPVCSFYQARPSILGCYTDSSGSFCNGVFLRIGTVAQMKSRDDSELTQRVASGVEPSIDADLVKRATVRLSTIWVNLYMK